MINRAILVALLALGGTVSAAAAELRIFSIGALDPGMLRKKMGIADKLKAKTTRFPNGGQVGNHVIASTNNEIGFLPIPYIRSNEANGLQYVGPLPADIQNFTVYEGAVMTGSKSEAAARDFLKFVRTEGARKTFAAAGVD